MNENDTGFNFFEKNHLERIFDDRIKPKGCGFNTIDRISILV
jgi:hypothetical protein